MSKLFKSKLFIQVAIASLAATLATAGLVGAATTIGSNITSDGNFINSGTATIYGTTSIGGALTATSTLAVTGTSAFTGAVSFAGNASTTGSAIIKSASINSDTGTISFGDDNLATTGTLTAGATTLSSTLEITGLLSFTNASSTGWLKTATINSDTGAVAFGTNDITTTGSLAATGARVTKGWFTNIESTNMPIVGGTSINAIFSPLASPTFTGTVVLPTVTLGGIASSTQAGVGMQLNGLTVYGDTTITGALTANNLNFAGGAITGVTNLTASGNLAFATASSTGTVKFGSINSDTGSVDFNNENITTSGTVDGIDISTIPSTYALKANPTFTGTVGLPAVNVTGDTNLTTASSTGLVKAQSLLINDTSSIITRHIHATLSAVDFVSMATPTCTVQQKTVTGVASGDSVTANPVTGIEAGLIWSAFAYTTDTVEIRLCNISGTNPLDPAARDWIVDVWKH